MNSCCSHSPQESTGKFFSKRSKRYARSFRKGKLDAIQKLLVNGIQAKPILGKSILEIGCGVGSVHLTLLKNGAARATGVDMAEQMLEHARRYARQYNVEAKTSYILGDFTTISDSIESADVTILDKVVCCYEDIGGLVKQSTAKTNIHYAITFPAGNLWTEMLFKVHIGAAKLFRFNFRPYWHDWKALHRFILDQGFTLQSTQKTISWQMAVYQRTH